MRAEVIDGALVARRQGETLRIEAWGTDALRVRATRFADVTGNDWALTEDPGPAVAQVERVTASEPCVLQERFAADESAWRVTNGRIAAEAAERGIRLARQEIKEGVFDATYRELSNGDLKFLKAMLPDSHGSTLADVSARMGVKSNYSTKYKSRLLSRGVIGERPDGTLDFDLPGFREYLGERERRTNP